MRALNLDFGLLGIRLFKLSNQRYRFVENEFAMLNFSAVHLHSNIQVSNTIVTYQDGTGSAEVVCSSAALAVEFARTLKALSNGA